MNAFLSSGMDRPLKEKSLQELMELGKQYGKEDPSYWIATKLFDENIKKIGPKHNDQKEAKNFSKKVNLQLNKIIADQKSKKTQKTKEKKNKHFYGNPKNAQNATTEEIDKYFQIKKIVNKSYEDKKINTEELGLIHHFLDALRILHTNNKQICEDLSSNGVSDLYDQQFYPSLHTETKDLPFENTAPISTAVVFNSFDYSVNEGCTIDFFKNALAQESGCLNARIRTIDKWLEKNQIISSGNDNIETLLLHTEKYLGHLAQETNRNLNQIFESAVKTLQLCEEINHAYSHSTKDNFAKNNGIILKYIKDIYGL